MGIYDRNRELSIDIDVMKSYLRYDEIDGEVYWIKCRSNRVKPNTQVGGINNAGYRRMSYENKEILLHRIIWALYYGYWPDHEIDHKDGNTLNNKIDNLRAANRLQQIGNTCLNRKNTSGIKGVSFHKKNGNWRAQINKNRRCIHLGSFSTREDAERAYIEAARIHFGNEWVETRRG